MQIESKASGVTQIFNPFDSSEKSIILTTESEISKDISPTPAPRATTGWSASARHALVGATGCGRVGGGSHAIARRDRTRSALGPVGHGAAHRGTSAQISHRLRRAPPPRTPTGVGSSPHSTANPAPPDPSAPSRVCPTGRPTLTPSWYAKARTSRGRVRR
jgi:hypothetical protein